MNVLRKVHFPPPLSGLLGSLSEVGFFDRFLLIGSWVMPLYQELYGSRYLLRMLHGWGEEISWAGKIE